MARLIPMLLAMIILLLIAGLSPPEVELLKRLLGRLQTAAGQLAGDATR